MQSRTSMRFDATALEGTDGQDKMSKSYGNDIGLTDSPEEMYGKTMSITDEMIVKYFRLAADASDEVVDQVEIKLKDTTYNPRDAKRLLARSLVELYYGVDDALKAEKHFDQVVVNKNIPDNIPEYKLVGKVSIVDAIFSSKVVESKSEVRRLIKQIEVSIDGNKLDDVNFMLDSKATRSLRLVKDGFENKMKKFLILFLAILFLEFVKDKTKLVVYIVSDQLTPDLMIKYDSLFTGGFRWLKDNGVDYPNTFHNHGKPILVQVILRFQRECIR